jgi:hypothetical protein
MKSKTGWPISVRHKRTSRWLLVIATGVALTVGLVISPAHAQSLASSSDQSSSAPTCSASELHVTGPADIPGFPGPGMGKVMWNILVRNTGKASCALAGWPSVQVRESNGKLVSVKVRNVPTNGLDAVPDARIGLASGAAAVVTVNAEGNAMQCAPRSWALRLIMPGVSQPVAVGGAGLSGICISSTEPLSLSPVYALTSLTRMIAVMDAQPAHPVYPVTTAKEPAACTTADLTAELLPGTSGSGWSAQMIRLKNTSAHPCVMPSDVPTLSVHQAGGAIEVAKTLASAPPRQVKESRMLTYEHSGSDRTSLPLAANSSAVITLLSAATGSAGSCHQTVAVTIYPSLVDLGQGLPVTLRNPVSVCGVPRVMPFLTSVPATTSLAGIGQDLAAAAKGTGGIIKPDGDTPPGFWYGSDSFAPIAPTDPQSDGLYEMPNSPTGGSYGAYMGQVGTWSHWEGCPTGALQWVQQNFNDAESNWVNGAGVGAAPVWMMAGPGREPNYSATNTTEAYDWGVAQAQRVVSTDLDDAFTFPYVFMDIEADTSESGYAGDDYNGWDNIWAGPCDNTLESGKPSGALERQTFNGFWNYIADNTTGFSPAVYNAGGGGSSSWDYIFGSSETLANTAEWTFEPETPSLSEFPSDWSVDGQVADWFASAPSDCELAWQWSGGGGVLNGIGDFDQIDGSDDGICN